MHSGQSEPVPIPWTPNLARMLAKSTRQACSMCKLGKTVKKQRSPVRRRRMTAIRRPAEETHALLWPLNESIVPRASTRL